MDQGHDTWSTIVERWPVISGVTLATFYGAVRVKRRLFSGYVTSAEMLDCKTQLLAQLEKIDDRNRLQLTHITDLLIKHIDKRK